MSRTKAMTAADKAYSKYIRLLHADRHTGLASCVTCGHTDMWKNFDCGHYITRYKQATRFEPRNTAPQCIRCNRHNHGETEKFGRYLMNKYGPKVLWQLRSQSETTIRLTATELQTIAAHYRAESKKLNPG